MAVGPLDICIDAPDRALLDVIATSFAVYDLSWRLSRMKRVDLDCQMTANGVGAAARGEYLQTARMAVDRTPGGMRATTDHGAGLDGQFGAEGERWQLRVPADVTERGLAWEIEDLLSLVITTGWRRAGWVPLHAGAVTDGRRGAIVCAGSGGGKTTFTMALTRAGWRSLGDDKLLLRTDGSEPLVGALKHMLNVDPAVDAWFPEIGNLRGLPEYSAWTPKRRVALTALWPDSTVASMRPTTILSLERRTGTVGFTMEAMDATATVAALLRQTVIPTDPDEARWITGTLAACARGASGVKVILGDDAYTDRNFAAKIAEHIH
jgi:hypothetical protein